jgi:hypothetical protein
MLSKSRLICTLANDGRYQAAALRGKHVTGVGNGVPSTDLPIIFVFKAVLTKISLVLHCMILSLYFALPQLKHLVLGIGLP